MDNKIVINDMNIEMNEGFNLVYAKKGGSPKNIYFSTRLEVTDFLVNNLNNINFLSINDSVININKLVNENKYLSRYLKLKKEI